MTLQDLVQLLQQQAASAPHQITLDDAALGRNDLDNLIKQQLQRAAGNIIVVINPSDIPAQAPASSFSLAGFLPSNQADSFLNLTNKNVSLTFIPNGPRIDLVLDITLTKENDLPVSWSFGSSFSTMQGSTLDSLNLSDPHFMLTTSASPYMQNSKLTLSIGLNFSSPLSLSGPLDVVATLISKNAASLSNGRSALSLLPGAVNSTPLFLFGAIALSDQGDPTFDFQADLGIPALSIGNVLALESLFVGTRRLFNTDTPPKSVTIIYMGATVQIQNSTGTQVNLDLYALLSREAGSPTMTMLLLPHTPTDTSIAHLGRLIAGNSWNSLFSGPAQQLQPYLDTFALKSFSAAIGLGDLSLLSLSLSAGIVKPWTFFDGKFTIATFDVAWLLLSPTKNATMTATLTTEFQLFGDPNLLFDLEISVPALTMSGLYKGTLAFTLTDLFNKVGTFFGFSLAPPGNLATFQFSALSLFIDEPNKGFTFSGTTQIALNLFGIELLGLQNTSFSVAVDGQGGHTVTMNGTLIVLGIAFVVDLTFKDEVTFQINLADMTFGALLSYLVSLVDPELDFTLDAPWDVLNSINLSTLALDVNVTKGTVNVKYTLSLQLDFIEINAFELTYAKKTGLGGVKVALDCTFFGINYGGDSPLAWDALNEAPPAVPGKDTSLFDLEYLGLGQHLALVDASGHPQMLDTVSKFIDALQSSVIPSDDATAGDPTKLPGLAFAADNGWLIGARFTVIGTVALSIIFNDPVVYGLLIALSGEKAKIFAGLSFEILYRRVTDTIGVYHTELKLPDYMRHLEFGEVSLTLPVVALDVYTNGDFKIDIGFPTDGDFTRSFAVDAFPFVGAGGFYFAKLSGATATNLPQITNGNFNPVIEFGIGLRIGLGKDISEGVFSAGISIVVQGIFEGTFAWFNPNDAAAPKDMYYKIQGVVAIIGHVYGSIDFEVVQASVDFEVYAAVRAIVEVYQPILLDLVAGVSVSVSLKILFFSVSFSFSATIRLHFTLGSASPTPWQLAPASPATAQSVFARTSHMQMLATLHPLADSLLAGVRIVQIGTTNSPPNWQPLQVWAVPKTLDLYFQPLFTYGLASDDLNNPTRPVPGANDYDECKGLVLFFIQNGQAPNTSSTVPFNVLMQTVLAWTIHAYDTTAPTAATTPLSTCTQADNTNINFGTYVQDTLVDLASLQLLYAYLTAPSNGSKITFTHQNLVDLFAQNFCFNVMPPPALGTPDMSMSVFPMFPELKLTIPGQSAGASLTVDFTVQNAVTSTYLTAMQDYLNQLRVDHQNQVDKHASQQAAATRATRNAQVDDALSIANFVFQDYFALLIRSAVQCAIDYLNVQKSDTNSNPSMPLFQLLTDLAAKHSFDGASGMVSRFLLHGLRLPEPSSLNAMLVAATPHLTQTHPLYAFTGQQFTVYNKPTSSDTYVIKLQSSAPLNWLKWTVGGQAASELDYQLTGHDLSLLAGLSLDELKGVLSGMTVSRLVLYREDNRRYNFQHRIVWNTQTQTLWDFPDSLRTQLATLPTTDPLASLNVSLLKGTPDASVSTGLKTTSLQAYAWGTLIDMRVQHVSNLAANGDLSNTYAMVGTNEVGRGYLEALWNYMTQLQINGQATLIPRLYVLYQPQAGGGSTQKLLNQDPQQALLLKTNLSTESHSQSNFAALTRFHAAVPASSTNSYGADIGGLVGQNVTTNLQFIKLLWECSVVNSGGYYFNYLAADGASGLADYLFSDGKTALLHLLIVLEPASSTSLSATQLPVLQAQVRSFHNTVVLKEDFDANHYFLFATTTDAALQVKVPTVGPGNVGFVSSRAATNDVYTLSSLYHLLNYTVTAQANVFNPSNPGLPIGPGDSVNDATPEPVTGGAWNYRKIVPYAKFAVQNVVNDANDLPSAKSNPYAGISGSAKATLELAVGVNDVYGNQLQESFLAAPALEVGYTDAVIGISEWPALAGTYYFEPKDSTTAQLWALLHLNTAPYMPDQNRSLLASMSKAMGDLAKYAQIYYQISQQDVTFTLDTSVVTLPNGIVDKSSFIGYVIAIYRYLASVTQLHMQLLNLQTASSLVITDLATVYHVDAAAFATQNSAIINLFAPGTTLQVPGYYQVQFGDSWQSIAQASKMSDLADKNKFTTLLLQPGTIIAIGTVTYIATGSEQLADIAANYTYVVPGDIAHANTSAALNPAIQLILRGVQITTQAQDTLTVLVNRYNSTYKVAATNQLTPYEVGATNPSAKLFAAGPLTVPINHQIGIADTLASIVALYTNNFAGLTVDSLVTGLQSNTSWLQSGAHLLVDVLTLVSADGDTFDVLTSNANDIINTHNKSTTVRYVQITASDLATFNANLSLYPQMGPDVNHRDVPAPVAPMIPYQLSVNPASPALYSLKVSDTLSTLANNDPDYASDLATANKAIANILSVGIMVTLGGISLVTRPNDTFQTLLEYFNAQLKQSYCIRTTKLDSLRAAGMSTTNLTALAQVSGVFVNDASFLTAVQSAIGVAQTATYRVVLLELARQSSATSFVLSDLAGAIFNTTGLFRSGQTILLPPPALKIGVSFTPNAANYTVGTIFPVTAAITIMRNAALVSSDFQDVATVIGATAQLTARPLSDPSVQTGTNPPTSLRQFAQSFQAALPELKLATGTATKNIHSDIEAASRAPHIAAEDTANGQSEPMRRLWAVKTGVAGFVYHIVQNKAYYFAPAPLSTTLMSGQVMVQGYQSGSGLQPAVPRIFTGIDLDEWARTFLAALDRFLDADFIVPAFNLGASTAGTPSKTAAQLVQDILDNKQVLATAIANGVTNILHYPGEDVSYQRSQAADALMEALLIHLSSAYTSDAICVVPVMVEQSPYTQANKGFAPRLSGKPVMVMGQNQVNSAYSLSTAKVPLYQPASQQAQPSYLTFLFSTKTPSSNKDVSLNLSYAVNELEFNIQDINGIAKYQASSWLSFVLPFSANAASDPHTMGTLDIPVPLRVSPLPPSLVAQQVIAQNTGSTDLASVRAWTYQYTYEHLNAVQDNIHTDVLYNVPQQSQNTPHASTTIANTQNVFNALANFITAYPDILADINLLPYTPTNAAQDVKNMLITAIAALSQLVSNVAMAWQGLNVTLSGLGTPDAALQYEYLIAESLITDKPGAVELTLTYAGQSSPAPMPLPDVAAAGYAGVGVPDANQPAIIYTLTPNGTGVTVPQRTLSIANRDVVTNWQNAWGGVWLTRNEQLVSQAATNPVFIYRTPEIRFNTPAVPLLRDSQLRDVALISGTGQARTLVAHIKALFSALFPVAATYMLKLTCTYSFYVAMPAADASDSALAASVPVLLYRQPTDLASDAFYVQVASWLDGWRTSNTLPTEIAHSFYQFDIALFSSLGAGVDGQEHVLMEVNNFQLAFKDIL